MPSSYSHIGLHFIFSTKERKRFITSELKERLYPYIGGIIKSLKCIPVEINATDDHIHIYSILNREITTADFMKIVKSKSSKWVHETFPDKIDFGWQEGYGAFSVSKSSEINLIKYIQNQEKHHKKISFKNEFEELLELYNINFDKKYLW